MKTLLKNGVVVDGSGSNRYQADVLIDGDLSLIHISEPTRRS